ncbi:MAG: hypothetical protein LC753_00725 [Acidobacteria bacterium]|nr:hypothetical protein [Acidobacteriota bacterium]MCA1648838.1 hypothetical protein [Acidobacteriota bacterium]
MKRLLLVAAAVCAIPACAAKPIKLPSGAAAPFPDYAAAYEQTTQACRSVRTLSAVIGLSGRAGGQRIRGGIEAGFAAPDDLRLEGVGPFGRVMFVLVSTGGEATLVLPRDGRVVRGAPAAAIVEALAGVALGPGELRAVVSGCGFGSETPTAGRMYGKGWAAVDVAGTTAYLRQADGRWVMQAAVRGPVTVEYQDFASGRPATIKLRTSPTPPGAAADLTLRLSQVEINVPLAAEVFRVDVPANAAPLTLEELRRAGPLGGHATR